MPYVTCSNSVDGEIRVNLYSRIDNVREVGVVEFFYDASKLVHDKLTNVEKQVTLEYSLDKDEATVLPDFPNCTIKGLLYDYKPVYSAYYYDGQIPRLEGGMTAVNLHERTLYPERTFSFARLFSRNLVTRSDFKINIKFSNIAPANEPLNRPRDAKYVNISVMPSTNNFCIFKVDMTEHIPYIHFTINRAAYDFFEIERLEQLMEDTDKDYITIDERENDTYHRIVRESFQHTFSVPDLHSDIVRKIVKKQFNGWDTRSSYTIKSDILHSKTNLVEFEHDYNKFVHAFTSKHNITVTSPILEIREGRLYSKVDVPKQWSIKISRPLRLYLGLPLDTLLGKDRYGGMIIRANVATVIKCPALVYNSLGQDADDIAVIPSLGDKWYRPNSIKYAPLTINNITNFSLHITDYDGQRVFLDNLQFFIVLHFKSILTINFTATYLRLHRLISIQIMWVESLEIIYERL